MTKKLMNCCENITGLNKVHNVASIFKVICCPSEKDISSWVENVHKYKIFDCMRGDIKLLSLLMDLDYQASIMKVQRK